MGRPSDEELLAAIATGPGAFPEFYRRHVAQRWRAVQAEQRISGRALLDPDDYARVEEGIDAAARLRQTYLAMRELPEQDRRLLELVAVDGLGAREAAHALKLTPVAARVRLSRARGRLRVALTRQDGPGSRALHTIQEGSA
jgi:RNA polymerase sigma-70 factor, ECF subfamily